tara:strand:- start:746 stop:1102 length:357 start_codon:yes stop_codon:yes gene_type:complete
MSRRTERVNVLLKKQIGEIIVSQINDPRLTSLITITSVEVSPDLGRAKVFTSAMGSSEDIGVIIDTLNKASGYLRRELKERIVLRNIPLLHFVFDDSIEKAQRMLDLISDVRDSDNNG